jgi:High potential iron-sulfur protein
MTTSNRRTFIIHAAVGSAALCCGSAMAAPKKIEENDPKGASLGYRHDSAQVDAKRFPKHTPAEKCNNCMAWLGKSSDAWAECDLTPDKLVANGGWCSSYVKAS